MPVLSSSLMEAAEARRWIRGVPRPDADPVEHFLDLPRDEQRERLHAALAARMGPSLLARQLAADEIDAAVDHFMNTVEEEESNA
jgi:hypothetical protein